VSYTYDYPRPTVTVDVVVFGLDMTAPPTLNVLLIKRGRPGTPFQGCWAIPGGFVNENEDLDEAARRELREETHAEPTYIEQLATFGKPGRDPRGHVISVAYMALVRTNAVTIEAGDDAEKGSATWMPVSDLGGLDLAFDHAEILSMALKRLRSKVRWQPLGIDLLPETFAIDDLQRVYEVVLGRELNRRNFRTKVLSYNILVPVGSQRIGGLGRPADLWRFDRVAYETMADEGGEFEV
jgi:8-oxo-dGTP diphosphatase